LPMDWEHNQIMRCIICHNDYVGLEILAMQTRCRKGLIAYHESNDIIAIKNILMLTILL
jgi:hypothetical protein